MMTTEQVAAVFAHPAMIALMAIAKVTREGGDFDGTDMFSALCDSALAAGVEPMSDTFDEAAERVGMPYSRELDLYCSREMRDEARQRYGHLYRNARERY